MSREAPEWMATVSAWLATSRPREHARILLVEDSTLNAEATRSVLVRAEHHVELAGDGAIALAMLERETYDLVLMDVRMPVVDGLEATRRLRAREAADKRPRTAVVALTSSTRDADARECIAAGMDAHLTKPVDADKLLSVVAALARRA